MGSFPHEFPGYRHVSDEPCARCSKRPGRFRLQNEPGLRISEHDRRRHAMAPSRASTFRAKTSFSPIPTRKHITAGLDRHGMRRGAGSFPERDRELRARLLPGIVVPRKRRHLHQRRTAASAACARRFLPWPALADWEITMKLSDGPRLSDAVPASVGNHGRDRAADSDLRRRQLRQDR